MAVWNYKILVVVKTNVGVTSQMLHYQDYDTAEEAYDELTKAPTSPEVQLLYMRLYKKEDRYQGWSRKDYD